MLSFFLMFIWNSNTNIYSNWFYYKIFLKLSEGEKEKKKKTLVCLLLVNQKSLLSVDFEYIFLWNIKVVSNCSNKNPSGNIK